MLKILGEHYYLDLDEIEEYINIPQTTATTENHISIVKYEIVKVLMDTILTENEPVDEMFIAVSLVTAPMKMDVIQ